MAKGETNRHLLPREVNRGDIATTVAAAARYTARYTVPEGRYA